MKATVSNIERSRPVVEAKASKKIAGPSTDKTDSFSLAPQNSENDFAAQPDSIIDEYGPLFIVDKEGKAKANQLAIAAMFSRDEQVVFDKAARCFRRYDSKTGLWDVCDKSEVELLLAGFIKTQAEKNGVQDFLPKRTKGFLGAVTGFLAGFEFKARPEARDRIIHVGNGMLDMSGRTPKRKEFSPDYASTKRVGKEYKPGAKCPRFLEELLGPALSAENVGLLQRYLGSVLLGGNPAQRLLVIYGCGGTGKSTVVTVVEDLLGIENVANLRTEHLSGRFESHSYQGRSLLTAKDVSCDYLQKSGAKMVKSLVGADLIESERKFGGKHRMRGNFDIIITSNTRLRVNLDGDKEAWGRRLLVVRFNATNGTKRVSNFAQVLLREEAEGILAWIVEGARQFLAELDAAGDFKLTQSQSKAIDSVIEESASAEVFIKTGVVRMEGADATTSEIMDAYEEWCGSRGWEPESERDFKKHLDGRMRKYHRSKEHHGVIRNEKAARGYAGVTFVTANAAAPEPPVEKKQRRRAKKAKGRKGVVKMRQRKGAKNARGRKGAANNR